MTAQISEPLSLGLVVVAIVIAIIVWLFHWLYLQVQQGTRLCAHRHGRTKRL